MGKPEVTTELSEEKHRKRAAVETILRVTNHRTKKKPCHRRRRLWEQPPKITISIGDPIPYYQLELMDEIIKKAKLRRLTTLHQEAKPVPQKQNLAQPEVNKPRRHIIHKAIKWQKMLETGEIKSQSEIAKKEGLTRARVTQIMNLLKLPPHWTQFLLKLNDAKEICKYSERKLRNYHYPCSLCPIKKEYQERTEFGTLSSCSQPNTD
ncbi:MAG: hypothetical protein ACFFCW_21580 [Candidatus Hodarchaeota archaeon]